MEEANGLVRWPEEAPALGQREEDLQGLPLVEMPRKNSGAEAEPEAEGEANQEDEADEDAANQDVPDVGALLQGGGGGDHAAMLPHFRE